MKWCVGNILMLAFILFPFSSFFLFLPFSFHVFFTKCTSFAPCSVEALVWDQQWLLFVCTALLYMHGGHFHLFSLVVRVVVVFPSGGHKNLGLDIFSFTISWCASTFLQAPCYCCSASPELTFVSFLDCYCCLLLLHPFFHVLFCCCCTLVRLTFPRVIVVLSRARQCKYIQAR